MARLQSKPLSSPLRILIVDDEHLVTSVLKRLFTEHILTVAHSGAEALRILQRTQGEFDVVLCDVMMPTLSGIDIYGFCRDRLPGLEQRIVFMSGGPANPQICDALNALPNPCIDKPFDLIRLQHIVEEKARAAS